MGNGPLLYPRMLRRLREAEAPTPAETAASRPGPLARAKAALTPKRPAPEVPTTPAPAPPSTFVPEPPKAPTPAAPTPLVAPTPAPPAKPAAPAQPSAMERLRAARAAQPVTTPEERTAHATALGAIRQTGVGVREPEAAGRPLSERTQRLQDVQRALAHTQTVATSPYLSPSRRGLQVRMREQPPDMPPGQSLVGEYNLVQGTPYMDIYDHPYHATLHEGGHMADEWLGGGFGHYPDPKTGEQRGGLATEHPEHELTGFVNSLRETPEHQALMERARGKSKEHEKYYGDPAEVLARFHNRYMADEDARRGGAAAPPIPGWIEDYSPETMATYGPQYQGLLDRAGEIARAQGRPGFRREGPWYLNPSQTEGGA